MLVVPLVVPAYDPRARSSSEMARLQLPKWFDIAMREGSQRIVIAAFGYVHVIFPEHNTTNTHR